MDSSSDDSDDGKLEILPPSSSKDRRSSLSSTGGNQQDPIDLDEEDSDEAEEESGDGKVELPLKERLAAMLQAAKKKHGPNSSETEPENSSRYPHASRKAASAACAKQSTTGSRSARPSSSAARFDLLSSSSSDESSVELGRGLLPSKRPLPSEDGISDSSSISDESIQREMDLIRRERKRGEVARRPDNSKKSKASSKEQRAREKAEIQAEKERKRREREAERERTKKAKEEAKADREKARLAKKAAEESQKQHRQQVKKKSRQRTGRHATEEVAVLMDDGIYHHSELSLKGDLEDADFQVFNYPSMLGGCQAIQFARKDWIKGGAKDAVNQIHCGNRDGYDHIPLLCVLFDKPRDFINMLEKETNEEDDDYPLIHEWLSSLVVGWRSAWGHPATRRPRIILFLYQVSEELDKMWIEYRRRDKQNDSSRRQPPGSHELEDAISWILIQFQVECVKCSEAAHVSHEICKMTRMLCEQPYQQQSVDLECIIKLKRVCHEDASLYDQAKDIWIRQLQQMPKLSFDKARALTRHYPTLRSLWRAYQNDELSEDDRQLLVADLFSDKRHEGKLSTLLHRLLTSEDPNEFLH